MKIRYFIPMILVFLFKLIFFQTSAIANQINWQEYDQGILKAKEKNKNIFLHFHADWCKYCVKMGNTTFKDEQVVKLLNTFFIPIEVDAEKQQAIAAKYGVTGLPNAWFLNPDASPLSRLPGYVDGVVFAHILNYIETKSFEKMSFKEFTRTL